MTNQKLAQEQSASIQTLLLRGIEVAAAKILVMLGPCNYEGVLSGYDRLSGYKETETRVRSSIEAVLSSLVRMGRVSPQDGRYALRLAA
mgnify:CR=1 FL=1